MPEQQFYCTFILFRTVQSKTLDLPTSLLRRPKSTSPFYPLEKRLVPTCVPPLQYSTIEANPPSTATTTVPLLLRRSFASISHFSRKTFHSCPTKAHSPHTHIHDNSVTTRRLFLDTQLYNQNTNKPNQQQGVYSRTLCTNTAHSSPL